MPTNGKSGRACARNCGSTIPTIPGMTALYLERYLNYGLTREELTAGKPIIGIAQTGSDLSPCNRHHLELAKRVREGIRDGRRHRVRVSDASDPGDRQAADRGARPQSRLSRPGRGAVRLSARRRRAHHRLRQDHAGRDHGGGDREHSGDRALGRADAQRLVEGRARRLRHRGVVGAPGACRRPHGLQGVPRSRRVVGAVDRPLQHHGHGLDHECARRGARHVAAGLRRHPGALSRARADRLRDRPPRGRDRARGPEAVRHPHPRRRSRTPSSPARRSAARPMRRSTSMRSPATSASRSRSRTGKRSATTCRCSSTCSRPASISARNITAPAGCRR